jgi:hypothetical protein
MGKEPIYKIDNVPFAVIASGEDEPKPRERKGIIANIKETQQEIRDAFKNAGLTIVDIGIVALHILKGISKKDK